MRSRKNDDSDGGERKRQKNWLEAKTKKKGRLDRMCDLIFLLMPVILRRNEVNEALKCYSKRRRSEVAKVTCTKASSPRLGGRTGGKRLQFRVLKDTRATCVVSWLGQIEKRKAKMVSEVCHC